MSRALPVATAAAELGVAPKTLRRWLRAGAPAEQRGHRGRGCGSLVDPDAVRRWLAGSERERTILAVAHQVPELLAEAVARSHQLAEGIDKRALAGVLVATWAFCCDALVDNLRKQCPEVPEPVHPPEPIRRLKAIARSRK